MISPMKLFSPSLHSPKLALSEGCPIDSFLMLADPQSRALQHETCPAPEHAPLPTALPGPPVQICGSSALSQLQQPIQLPNTMQPMICPACHPMMHRPSTSS